MFERKKVLLAHPFLASPGGGESLAAYVLQAENFTLYQIPKWLTSVLEHGPLVAIEQICAAPHI